MNENGSKMPLMLLSALIGGLISAALVTGAFVLYLLPTQSTTSGTTTDTKTGKPVERVVTASYSAEEVAAKVTPSVVSVGVEQTMIDPATGQSVTGLVGNGSGVIIRADGHILTNDHVVADADALVVTIGVDEVPATIVGRDPSSDLAVIKVDRDGLPAAELGSSADLRVGQPLVAIGSPFGLDKTVTTGIVSALGRTSFAGSGSQLTAYTAMIQTDAAINPGNSGGALCDENGKVVGINTLIQSPSGEVGAPQSAGIGFAIPIDYAKTIAEELIKTGKATHPFMGIYTVTVSPSVAQQYDLPVDAGAYVQDVQKGSPADDAGIEPGDIIIEIAGQQVASGEDVFAAIRAHKVGERVDVVVMRDGNEKKLTVTLGSDQGS